MATGIKQVLEQLFNQKNYSYQELFAISSVLVLALIFFQRTKAVFCSSWFWGAISSLLCCYMIGGHNARHMGKHGTSDGQMEFVYRHWSLQYTYEGYMMSTFYALGAFGMILMIEAAGGVKSDGRRRRPVRRWHRLVAVLGLVTTCFFFSMVLCVFRIKRPWYPYYFLIEQH